MGFYDAKGYWRSEGEAFYDSRGILVSPGGGFYDGRVDFTKTEWGAESFCKGFALCFYFVKLSQGYGRENLGRRTVDFQGFLDFCKFF